MTTTNIATEVEDVFQTIKADAIIAWDDFLKGVTYLKTEATALAAWAEKVDPAIQSQLQDFIGLAETAAAALVTHGGSSLSNVIAMGVDAAEQGAATVIANATGNRPGGLTAIPLVTAGITDLGKIVQDMATVGYARAIGAIAAAAAAPGH